MRSDPQEQSSDRAYRYTRFWTNSGSQYLVDHVERSTQICALLDTAWETTEFCILRSASIPLPVL